MVHPQRYTLIEETVALHDKEKNKRPHTNRQERERERGRGVRGRGGRGGGGGGGGLEWVGGVVVRVSCGWERP